MGGLSVIAWNIHSANTVVNRHALSLLLHQERPTVVVLTETYLQRQMKPVPGYVSYQSPGALWQGVAVLVREEVASQPYRRKTWSRFGIAVLVQDVVVLGTYV